MRKRGEDPGSIGAGVDPDAIGTHFDLGPDGMAVDDDEAMIGLVEQEGLADPAKVGLALLIELDARTNTGVDEEIIAEAAAVVEALEELHMLLRDRGANGFERIVFTHSADDCRHRLRSS